MELNPSAGDDMPVDGVEILDHQSDSSTTSSGGGSFTPTLFRVHWSWMLTYTVNLFGLI